MEDTQQMLVLALGFNIISFFRAILSNMVATTIHTSLPPQNKPFSIETSALGIIWGVLRNTLCFWSRENDLVLLMYLFQYSCLENPMDGGAWKAAVRGVAEGRTRLSDFTFTFHFHALEKEMATHSSVLAWRIPGTGKPGGLPSMGSHRIGRDWSDLAAAAAATCGYWVLDMLLDCA